MPLPPTCFVVMPYGTRPVEQVHVDFDALFVHCLAPAARAAGFQVVRSDKDVASSVIMARMIDWLYRADVVIAEVTYPNANVYYELGMRHALRPRGTLLLKRAGGDFGVTPLTGAAPGPAAAAGFDIAGLSIQSYEPSRDTLDATVQQLRHHIERVASAVHVDSPAFVYLPDLRVSTGLPLAHANDDATYEILGADGAPTGRRIGYRSGDLKELKDARAVDLWVNSENVLMQMARVYERSVSSTIRYLGARQPRHTEPGFDDTIAVDLASQLGQRHAVDPGEVLVTTSGRLRDTHQVKAILHAAVVTGSPGRGFEPIAPDLLIEAVRTVLATARELIRGRRIEIRDGSLIMPFFGAGQGRDDPSKLIERLVDEVIRDLEYHASTADPAAPDLHSVYFSAFGREHVRLLQCLFDARIAGGMLRRMPAADSNPS